LSLYLSSCRSSWPAALLASAAIAMGGCGVILGFEDHQAFPDDGEGASGATNGGGTGGVGAGGVGGTGGGEGGSTGGGGIGPGPGNGWVGMTFPEQLARFKNGSVVNPPIELMPSGEFPHDVTMHPTRPEVWVAGALGDAIVIVSTHSGEVIGTIQFAFLTYPVDVVFSQNGKAAYVSALDTQELIIVDVEARTISDTIPINGRLPGKMTLDPCSDTLYVAEWVGESLIKIDPILQTVEVTTNVGVGLWDIVAHPDGSKVYITDGSQDRVRIVETSSSDVTASITVGDDPWGIDITPDGATVVVVSEDNATMHFINTANNQATSLTLPSDVRAKDVDLTADGAFAYFASTQSAGNPLVYEVSLATRLVTNTVNLGALGEPYAIAVAPQMVTCTR